jgi:prophage regulatory protein
MDPKCTKQRGHGRCMLRLNDVRQRVGLSRSTIYERVREGDFPAPVQLGPRAVAWPSDEIDAWIDARITAGRVRPGTRGAA